MADMGDAPQRAVAVLGDEQRSIVCDSYTHWTAPDAVVVHYEPSEKVVVFAGRNAVINSHANYLVACARTPVPGAVEGRENVSAIFRRKCRQTVCGRVKDYL